MKAKRSSSSRITRCIKAPFRVLIKARDYYVKSMNSCAGSMNYNSSGTNMPRSFSVSSSRVSEDQDMRELIRIASLSRLGRMKVEETSPTRKPGRSRRVPRSFSVGFGKIDEEEACEFNEDVKVNSDVLYPRSKSYAVTKRTVFS